ncbi:hypothetical protein AMECASPLE_031950 [Ameca splendens]|uniref:Uncharacterized protein n=1 Tax=Ameca splendens TaxID=208324 RepID=A0ABV0Z4B6_9TELE
MEGSKGCSFPRAVPQRGWTPELYIQNNININTNVSWIPFTDHHSFIYCSLPLPHILLVSIYYPDPLIEENESHKEKRILFLLMTKMWQRKSIYRNYLVNNL